MAPFQVRTDNKPFMDNLMAALSKADYGSSYSWDALSKIAGTDLKKNRSLIQVIKRKLMNESQRVLVSVFGVGYRITKPNETWEQAQKRRKEGHRKVRLSLEMLQATPVESLTEDERKRFVAEQARSGVVLCAFRAVESRKLVDKATKAVNITVPSNSLLVELLRKK